MVPAQFQSIVKQTLELKSDIDFGYTITRSEMRFNELLGSRAYQRALNRRNAERIERMKQESQNH